MSTETAKTCWPWSHKWTKWELMDGTASNNYTGVTRDATVQRRSCTECGFSQIEGVRGR